MGIKITNFFAIVDNFIITDNVISNGIVECI
jgi:hypothetical protein